jgi:hypothetical protein
VQTHQLRILAHGALLLSYFHFLAVVSGKIYYYHDIEMQKIKQGMSDYTNTALFELERQ